MGISTRDKALLGGAALLALASTVVFGGLALRMTVAPLPQVQLAMAPYTPVAVAVATQKNESWSAPGSQARGREWIYDTFTPPEIFYHARTRQFTVRPPSSLFDEEAQEPFGLELLAVRPEPFRLQLIGYVGGEGYWRGTFQNVVTGEVFLAAAGHPLPKLALTVKSFQVRSQPVPMADSMTTRQRVATAVILDERTGREFMLTERERAFTGTVFAAVAAAGNPIAREVRAGEVFSVGEATYRVEAVSTLPASIEITKESPTLPQPERRVLLLREGDTSESDDAPNSGGSS